MNEPVADKLPQPLVDAIRAMNVAYGGEQAALVAYKAPFEDPRQGFAAFEVSCETLRTAVAAVVEQSNDLLKDLP